MMPDLMHQDVPHDRLQRLARLAPFVEDRAAVEEDHVDVLRRGVLALQAETDAAVEAEQVEVGFELHLVDRLLVGEILDSDDQPLGLAAELLGNLAEGLERDALEVVECGREGFDHGGGTIAPARPYRQGGRRG